jgi:hypothetical protein
LAAGVARDTGLAVDATDVLIDAPPVKLEVDIDIDVVTRVGEVHRLGYVSPITSVLAHQQFDSQVKRVRVFVRPELRESLRAAAVDWGRTIVDVIDSLDNEWA